MSDAQALADFLEREAPVAVLTGAGISTASGIGDYRDASGAWKRKPPIQHQAFMKDPAMRQRYWARSMHGFPAFARARPNTAHDSLVALEASGHVSGVITQNVDDLHQRAGQRWLEPLHGELHRIRCTACGRLSDRTTFQDQLELMNAPFLNVEASLAPDGDADLDEVDLSSFRVPACSACGGVLKPDVVFFGDSVPRERVKRSLALLDESRSLLVVGSSLMVFSGYRFVRHAQSAGQPVALLTRGVSRADDVLTLKLDADCADVLSATATLLGAG